MTLRREYDAIVFDVGGTLLNVVRDPHMAVVEAVAHLGSVSVTELTAGIQQAVAEWRLADGRPEVEDLPETWLNHNRRALEIVGFTGDVDIAAQVMEDTFLSDGWELYPDVAGTLAALSASGYRSGVVSNWPATLNATLEQVGIRQYFAAVVASADVGYRKPHPRIFQIAAKRLGLAPQDLLYVGDSVEDDVAGATSAGMDVILLDRNGRFASYEPRIQTLNMLLDLLEPRR